MREILGCLSSLVIVVGGILLFLLLLGAFASTSASTKEEDQKVDSIYSITSATEREGDSEMLPQHLWDQIGKILEEKTGVKIPRPKSVEDILTSMPAKDRAKLLPVLIPVVVDAIRESTGMNMDASLALQEYLVGQGLGLTELDVLIEASKMKLQKALAGRKQYKEIIAEYRAELGDDPFVDLLEKAFTYRLVQETFKDFQFPSGWSDQQVTRLLGKGPSDDDDQEALIGEVVDR